MPPPIAAISFILRICSGRVAVTGGAPALWPFISTVTCKPSCGCSNNNFSFSASSLLSTLSVASDLSTKLSATSASTLVNKTSDHFISILLINAESTRVSIFTIVYPFAIACCIYASCCTGLVVYKTTCFPSLFF